MTSGPVLLNGQASVLVVHVNHAVGAALAARLLETAAVSLSGPSWAVDALAAPARYDVVLLCPYLARAERAAVLAACARLEPRPAVLELADEVAGPGAHVRRLPLGADDGPTSPTVHSILAALELTTR